jgi:hypothetical protein
MMKDFKRLFMKIMVLVLSLAMSFTPNASYAGDIVIKEGTEVLLKVIDKLKSGEVKEGSVIQFLVEKAVTDENGFVLIPDDANAYGTVTKSSGAGMMGTSGSLEFTVDKVEAFNGKDIPLRGAREEEGTSSTGAVVAGALFVSVLSVFFRGSNAVVQPGTILRTYVDETTVISADIAPAKDITEIARKLDDYFGIVTSEEKTEDGWFAVLEVTRGGLCDIAGIKPGDMLTKIDAYDLKEYDMDRISSYIALRAGQSAKIKATVLRDGQAKVIEMQL